MALIPMNHGQTDLFHLLFLPLGKNAKGFEVGFHRLFHLARFDECGAGAGYKHNIVAGAHVAFQFAVRRADNPPATTALYGSPRFFAYGDTDPRFGEPIFTDIGHKQRVYLRFSAIVQRFEVLILI